jgi:hypothetical protein
MGAVFDNPKDNNKSSRWRCNALNHANEPQKTSG